MPRMARPPAPPLSRVERPAATAVLVGIAALAPIAVDVFLPSMPAMAREFDTSTGTLSLAVTLFIFAFAGAQLFWGPLSDRAGRRPALLAGLALFIAGSLLCLAAPSIPVLLAGRVLQGLGGGAGPAIANAVVIDTYRRERAIGILALITLSIALAPMIAPVFGGLIQEYAAWRVVFVLQAAVGLILAAAFLALVPETNRSPDPSALALSRQAANYRRLFRSRTFVTAALLLGLLFAGQLIFISTSSFVLVDDLGASPLVFGLSFGFVSFGIMAGATVCRRLSSRWPPGRIVLLAAAMGWTAAAVMTALALVGIEALPATVLPAFVILAGNGMARPAATATALADFPEMAGLASAVVGFTQMALASAASIAFSAAVQPGPATLAGGMAAASTAALGLFLLARPPAFSPRAPAPGTGAAAATGTPAHPSPPPR
ncbi:MAG: Bcr/CflA family drug resistance efflux transporter [Tepidiforma sp.]|nr:MAG: Bcr/CflA family drug resistance efflux transporter [Tepidiforma sp.]